MYICELYDKLSRLVIPEHKLEDHDIPCRDPHNPHLRKVPRGRNGLQQFIRSELDKTYTCERCETKYQVDGDGIPLPSYGNCVHHIRRISYDRRHPCCNLPRGSTGCTTSIYHIHRGELDRFNFEGYVETQEKPWRDSKDRHGIFALDCEMCHSIYGMEVSRVSIVDHQFELIYDKLVKPQNKILSYNTEHSGITKEQLDQTDTTLADVHRDLLDLFSSKSILTGHHLGHDMKVLKLFHKRFVDTSELYPHPRGLPFRRSLKSLANVYLHLNIQDATHDSKEDAITALRLVFLRVNR